MFIEILKVLKVEPEITCEQQTGKYSEVTFELFIIEEIMVREADPVQVNNVEFIIPVNLLQVPLQAKVMLSLVIFLTIF